MPDKIIKIGVIVILCFFTSLSYSQEFDGYTLYNKLSENRSFLIDKNEDIAHVWNLNTICNYAVLLTDSGNIIRGSFNNNNQIQGAAVGGRVEEFDPQGNLVWSFDYSSSSFVSHHDITLMPDGNVLLTAWEVKNITELRDMGYTGSSNQRYPTHFVEVSQNGTGGEIVWEWHIWDHLIQDVDPNKPNFGVVSEHPELMNINVATQGSGGPGGGGGSGDWFHVNGVDYNPELDLIAFSSRFMSEVYIIDHSTTSAEAASHTGGNSGKGGDFLYRWGNPSNYNTAGDQKIAGPVHDARWIPNDGRPRAGFLQFFNNRGQTNRSTVEAIDLPFDTDGYNFIKTPGAAYGPAEVDFRHTCLGNASGQSASNSMPNGNVFVSLSGGYMYEVDSNDNLIWQYPEGPAKGFRYTCDHPGIQALSDKGIIENLCGSVSTEFLDAGLFNISPNPSDGIFNLKNLADSEILEIRVFDALGQLTTVSKDTESLDLTGQMEGVYSVNILLANKKVISKKIALFY